MKRIIPIVLGSLVFSANTFAEDNLLSMDDDSDTIKVQRKSDLPSFKVPKRTSFFTGLEYTETVSETVARAQNFVYIVADGSTRIHPNFRLRYVLNQGELKNGVDQDTSARRTNFAIAPRYEQWVNHRFSFFAEPVYKHNSRPDSGTTTEIMLRPGAQFTFGDHHLNTIYTYSMVDKQEGVDPRRFDAFEFKANYTYGFTSKINFGLEFTRNGNIDNSDPDYQRRAFAIKPSVRFKHFGGMITEINVPYNYNESNADLSGSESIKVNLNNNYPFNRNVKIVANIGYQQIKLHENGLYYGKDKDSLTAKLGLNLSF